MARTTTERLTGSCRQPPDCIRGLCGNLALEGSLASCERLEPPKVVKYLLRPRRMVEFLAKVRWRKVICCGLSGP